MSATIRLLHELRGRIAARRRPREISPTMLEWTVGDPSVCPLRFVYRLWPHGVVTLVIFTAEGKRVLPEVEHQSLGFVPEQVDQLHSIFSAARERIAAFEAIEAALYD